MALEVTAYGADVWILATYWFLARHHRVRPYHYANGIGSFALLAVELDRAAYSLAVLTVAYIVIAWKGIKCT
jgi:hypothetical protein